MKLYHLAGSCALAPHIALEYCGLPYEAIRVERGQGNHLNRQRRRSGNNNLNMCRRQFSKVFNTELERRATVGHGVEKKLRFARSA
jgi:hypothetical protein